MGNLGGKLGGTLLAMVFGLPFGSVGLGAAYGIGSLLNQSRGASDWVVVQAKVDDARLTPGRGKGATYRADGVYRYTFEGKEYTSTRLGFQVFGGGTDNVGNWHQSMVAFLEDARTGGKTIPVYVNPDNPSQSVVDRGVRWAMIGFMSVFAVLFGGVGLVALCAIAAIWFARKKPAQADKAAVQAAKANSGPIASNARTGAIVGWVFVLIWNGMSFPMAAFAVPQMVARKEWLGLFVLIFPLIGLFLLWGAIMATFGYWRRGRATMALEPMNPRMNARMAGAITFDRAGAPGGDFTVKVCASVRNDRGGKSELVDRWSRELKVRAAPNAGGVLRIPFQFDLPGRIERQRGDAKDAPLHWQVKLKPAKGGIEDSFSFEVQPPLEPAGNLAPPVPTQDELNNSAAMARLFGAQAAAKMSPDQAAAVAALPQDAQALAAAAARNAGVFKYIVIGIVVLMIFMQIVGALLAYLRSST